ncbi:BspA family leucine-rich repeat surface protein, partial [Winogradskyella echinorum]
MKPYSVLSILTLYLLFSLTLNAQINFIEDTTVPFEGITLGDADFADIDNDGDQDLFIVGQQGGTIIAKLYSNDGLGNFAEVIGTPFIPVSMSSISFADIDEDNDQDILITGKLASNFSSTELYINDGSGNFTLAVGSPFENVQFGRSGIADVDGDNDLDILITGGNDFGNEVNNLYINDGSGLFTLSVQPFIPLGGYSDVAFADIDGDNDLDVLISGNDGTIEQSYLYTNDGSGNYTQMIGTPFEGVLNAAIGFSDINNDGDQDILITGFNGSGSISYLYENDGTGLFALTANQPLQAASAGDVEFADVDGDGNIDLIITDGTDSILYSNDCYGNFTEVIGMPFERAANGVVAFADVEGDGDQDLLIAGNGLSGPRTSLYVNESLPQPSVGAFITTWETSTANESITIPTTGPGYNYNIDWGDGNTTVGATGDASHTYLAAGTYQITITGLFPRIYFHGASLNNQYNIKSIDQWGCNAWETMSYAFSGCRFLVVNATDVPNLSNVTDTSFMFYQAKDLGGGTGNWNWDTSTITDMSLMFSGANTFNKDIGIWDTSNVMDMHNLFQQAWSFNQNINSWNTAMVTDMGAMFSEASDFNQPLNNWDTSSVTNFGSMFDRALVFNQDIGNWNTSQAINFSNMFGGAIVFNQDIGAWNTSNATHMTDMFYSAVEFDQDLGNWNVENVLYANGMFNLATLSIANYDSLLIGWNAQNLQPDVWFHGGFSQYCAGEAARTNMISSDNWYIQDGGFVGSTVDDLADQNTSVSFTFPVITGTNLSGNEAYYTEPNGTGTMYNAGDVINYADFASYPITLYIYDSVNDGCESQEDFELTITIPPPCTSLDTPLNGSVDVLIGTNLTWNLVSEATGYLLTVGTTSGGTDIVNDLDVGNVLTYDLPADLPENTAIYVSIIPYNADGNATGCTEESFTTENILSPPNCTSLSSPTSGSMNIAIDTDLTWSSVTEATGYLLTVGTTSGGTDIVNDLDVGNVLTYDLAIDLPENTVIYVSVIPYNADGEAIGCTEESF